VNDSIARRRLTDDHGRLGDNHDHHAGDLGDVLHGATMRVRIGAVASLSDEPKTWSSIALPYTRNKPADPHVTQVSVPQEIA
jgi:hypothetical protein